MIWNLHSHSRFSASDALPTVQDMVATVAGYNQPALGLTDHGNMAGTVQLYQACKREGIKPFPGSELYVVASREDRKAKRHHMCVVAYTSEGYSNLVNLSTLSHRNFHNKPLIDHADLAQLSEDGLLKGIAATSGCYFGYIAQALVRDDGITADRLASSYAKWFDRFYIELQNHNIVHDQPGWDDDRLADAAMDLADRLGLPCVLTQDSHYCTNDQKEIHDDFKRLVSYGSDPDDLTFPGDGFGLADEEWLASHHHPERFARGVEGLDDLLEAHCLSIPALDTYSTSIPFTVADPLKTLLHKTSERLRDLGLDSKPRYYDRFMEEASVIKDTGMAGYIEMVGEITDWCGENQVFTQARGSASGSLLCWLRGITQQDPIKWGLSFERFISRDRTKPPDIDLDVEMHRRQDLLAWLRTRFTVTQIGTWTKLSLHGDEGEDGDQASGSLRVKYYAYRQRLHETVHNWTDVPEEDKKSLERISDLECYSSSGTHAAGLVLTTTSEEVTRLAPLMHIASSGILVTQYPMDDIEALGLIKMDVLGLRTLSVLHRCMDNLGRDVQDGLDWIPLNDSKTYTTISRGDTDGVFQLEGWSARKGCKRLKPKRINDVIVAMALFRPAPQLSGATDDYIRRKNKDSKVPVRNPIVDAYTKNTYGVLLFQEQVISVLREIGLEAADLTKFLKAVKASNANIGDAGKVIDSYREHIWALAVDAGFSLKDWKWFWECCTGFALYGFNRSHSTAYGITAYRCAYLATNYPLDFYAALLAYADTKKKKNERRSKEAVYLDAARRADITIRRARVNYSDTTYAVHPKRHSIVRGLVSVDGIGEITAAKIIACRPEDGYENVEDLCRRTRVAGSKRYLDEGDLTVGVIGKLFAGGALLGLLDEAIS